MTAVQLIAYLQLPQVAQALDRISGRSAPSDEILLRDARSDARLQRSRLDKAQPATQLAQF